MRALRFAFATALVGVAFGCAPVQSKTHFQRWDEYAANTAAAEAKEASEAPADVAAPAASTPAAEPAGSTEVYGSGGGTPPITSTSTASRVVRPGDTPATGDEDVIY